MVLNFHAHIRIYIFFNFFQIITNFKKKGNGCTNCRSEFFLSSSQPLRSNLRYNFITSGSFSGQCKWGIQCGIVFPNLFESVPIYLRCPACPSSSTFESVGFIFIPHPVLLLLSLCTNNNYSYYYYYRSFYSP